MSEAMQTLHLWDTVLELEEKKKKEQFLGELNLEMEQRKTLFHQFADGDKPNQGEINSQILYNEPHGLNTNKDLPKVEKSAFKKGVYY